jgi:hypothetical protein
MAKEWIAVLRAADAAARWHVHQRRKAPPRRCLYRKLDSAIMMKSAEDRHSCDAAYVLDGAMDRRVFAKRPMSPRLIIISGILRQNPA